MLGLPLAPFQEVCASSKWVEEVVQEEDGREKKVKTDARHLEDSVMQMPWLTFLDGEVGFSSFDDKRPNKKATTSVAVVPEDKMVSTEEAALEALAELEKARAAMCAPVPREEGPFGYVMRGGLSQVVATGEAEHALQGKVRTAEGRELCTRHHLQQTFKSTFSAWGKEVSGVMVRGWSHRMNYFYQLQARAADGPGHIFSPVEIESYKEPAELTKLAEDCSAKLMQRIRFIRAIPAPNV